MMQRRDSSSRATPRIITTVVAAIQFKPVRGAIEENRTRLVPLVEAAAAAGAEIVVLPEMCTSGYIFSDPEAITPYCEARGGPTAQSFATLAKRCGVTLVYGWAEREEPTGRLYNSATVLFPDERLSLEYRKRLLFEADTTWAQPGDTPYPEWRTRDGVLATVGICMDLNDDRFIEHLQTSQARLCLFPTNWTDQGMEIWGYWAYRLQGSIACLVAANTYGREDDTKFRGESAVLDGRVLLAHTGRTGDDVVVARVPPLPTPWPGP